MVERIKKIMDMKNMSATQFSETIDIQRSSLSHVLSGRNKPSLDFMLKIKTSFPDINLDWLLLGTGKIYVEAEIDMNVEADFPTKEIAQPGFEFKDESIIIENEPDLGNSDVKKRQTEGSNQSGSKSKPVKIIMFYKDDSFEVFNLKQ